MQLILDEAIVGFKTNLAFRAISPDVRAESCLEFYYKQHTSRHFLVNRFSIDLVRDVFFTAVKCTGCY